jgi:two-component system sensor histidine kinase DesK
MGRVSLLQPSDDTPATGRRPTTTRFAILLGLVWLVFLAPPLREAWRAQDVLLRVLGVAGVVGLTALFVWAFLRYRSRRDVPPTVAAGVTGAQLGCVALITFVTQQAGLIGLVFVCVTVVVLLPLRLSAVAVAVLTLALYLLPRVVPGWQPDDGTVLSAVLASLAMYGSRAVIDRNRKLSMAQDEVAALAVTRERERIARDMHDILGHSLTVVSVKAELATRLLRGGAGQDGAPALTPGAERAATELAEIQSLARSALADMRGLVADERQVTLAGELAAARSALDTAGIAADLPGAVDDVAERHRETFAWALREGTTNVLRHAAARRVAVTLTSDALVIDDDGRGLRPSSPAASGGGGNGLTGLAERARDAGLDLETGPSPLGGARLAVRAPGAALTDAATVRTVSGAAAPDGAARHEEGTA